MFQAIVNRAQRSIDTLVSKYVTRAAVAVPFVIAVGFGTAAASVALTEMYGNLVAHTILAAGFAGVGVVAAVAIAAFTGPAGEATNEAPQIASVDATGAATDEPDTLDPATLMTAVSTMGPVALPILLRLLMRNLPLVAGVLVVAYLLFSDVQKSDDTAASTVAA